MTTLISSDDVITSTIDGPCLRIELPDGQQRIEPLPFGKSTIGSSERCHICLQAAQVRPLHCLIVVENDGVTATRWASGALLNGKDFSTASIQEGDCLTIGEVRLTIAGVTGSTSQQDKPAQAKRPDVTAQPAAPPQDAKAAFAFAAPKAQPLAIEAAFERPATNTTTPEFTGSYEATDRLVARLQTANAGARQRCRRLVDVLRSMRVEVGGLQQQVDGLEQQLRTALDEREEIFAKLSTLQGESSERERESAAEMDRLIAELTAAYEKAGSEESTLGESRQRIEQLEAEAAKLQTECDRREEILAAGEQQRSKLVEAVAGRERAIETLQQALNEARQAASSAVQQQQQQAATTEALQAQLEMLAAERDTLRNEQQSWQETQQQFEQTLTDNQQQLSVLEEEVEKLRLHNGQLQQALTERSAGYDNLENEYEALCAERDALVAKRTEFQLREQAAEHELAERGQQINQLREQIEELRTKLAESKVSESERDSHVAEVQQQLNTAIQERDKLVSQQEAQAEKLCEWETTVAERDRQIENLVADYEGVCQVLQSVETGAFEQVDACNKLETQLTSLREERDAMAQAVPERENYVKQLEATLADRDEQLELLSEELTAANERQENLEQELSVGKNDYETLQAEIEDLSSRYDQLAEAQGTNDEDMAAAEQMLTDYQTQVVELKQQLEAAHQQRTELEQTIAEGTTARDSTQEELCELKARYEQLQADYQSEQYRRGELDQRLAERQQNVDLYQVDLISLRAELERTIEQVSTLEAERETLKQQLSGLRDELAARDSQEHSIDSDTSASAEKLTQQLTDVDYEIEAAVQAEVENQVPEGEKYAEEEFAEQEYAEEEYTEHDTAEQASQDWAAQYDHHEPAATEPEDSYQPVEDQFEFDQPETVLADADEHSLDPTPPEQACSEQSVVDESVTEEFVSEELITEKLDTEELETEEQNYEAPIEEESTWSVESLQEPTDWPSELTQETTLQDEETGEDDVDDFLLPADSGDELTTTDDNFFDDSSEHLSASSDELAAEYASDLLAAAPVDAVDEEVDEEVDYAEQRLDAPSIEEPTSALFEAEDTDEQTQEEEFQPTSFIDQYQHLLEEDSQQDYEPVQPATQKNKLAAELDSMEPQAEDASDEAALEAYMANMLRRMRGESSEGESTPLQQPSAFKPNQPSEPEEVVENIQAQSVSVPEVEELPEDFEPIDMEKLKQSSKKPELPTDMAAMRALANSSARRAIANHYKRRHLEKALGQFFVCLISICVGTYMLMAGISSQEFLGLSFLGGATFALVGTIGGYKLLRLLLLAMREMIWEKQASSTNIKSSPKAAPQPQPKAE